jgi:hypothetical protein
MITHTEYRTVSDDTERLVPRPQDYRNKGKRGEKTNKIKE